MYRRLFEGWIKHFDFIVLDLFSLFLAFIIAYYLAGLGINPFGKSLYAEVIVYLLLADVVIICLFDTLKSVLKLGYYRDLIKTIQHTIILAGLGVTFLFLIQKGFSYSRIQFILTFLLYPPLTYFFRECWKWTLKKQIPHLPKKRNLLILTTCDQAEQVIHTFRQRNLSNYRIRGVAVLDSDCDKKVILDLPVVCDAEQLPAYLIHEWVDELLVVLPREIEYPYALLDQIGQTGVTIHIELSQIPKIEGTKQFVENVNGFNVLTYALNYASGKQLLLKRCIDICAGLAGCTLTALITVFIGPAIYLADPGPIFFSQMRIGKNGKPFRIYKFRSMYQDAEQQKKELMEQNKLHDEKMFKLDFDPRVIGNKILPDGTQKTGIGEFIRKTSLDEFPQFLNVLKGEMSLVGTRPPLVNEVTAYDPIHRSRLAIKPGLTGLWQVSGRSNIDSFDEVVRLDREYIQNWNLEMDLKIIFKTIKVVLRREGSS